MNQNLQAVPCDAFHSMTAQEDGSGQMPGS